VQEGERERETNERKRADRRERFGKPNRRDRNLRKRLVVKSGQSRPTARADRRSPILSRLRAITSDRSIGRSAASMPIISHRQWFTRCSRANSPETPAAGRLVWRRFYCRSSAAGRSGAMILATPRQLSIIFPPTLAFAAVESGPERKPAISSRGHGKRAAVNQRSDSFFLQATEQSRVITVNR